MHVNKLTLCVAKYLLLVILVLRKDMPATLLQIENLSSQLMSLLLRVGFFLHILSRLIFLSIMALSWIRTPLVIVIITFGFLFGLFLFGMAGYYHSTTTTAVIAGFWSQLCPPEDVPQKYFASSYVTDKAPPTTIELLQDISIMEATKAVINYMYVKVMSNWFFLFSATIFGLDRFANVLIKVKNLWV